MQAKQFSASAFCFVQHFVLRLSSVSGLWANTLIHEGKSGILSFFHLNAWAVDQVL